MAKIIVNNPKQVINGGAKKYYFKVKGLGGLKGDKGDKGDKGEDGKMPTIAQITGQSTTEVMSQKATTDALNAKQATISSSNKLSADLVDDANTTNKFVTSEDKETWNAKQNTLTAGENIEISNDVIRAKDTTYTAGNGLNLNGTEFSADTTVLATKEDLEGYYTKPETDNLLAPKLESEVLTELPTTGEKGKLYLTPKSHTTQTATGNPITATVAEEAGALEGFQLYGDTFQQSYGGKNLFDPSATPTVIGHQTFKKSETGFTATVALNNKTETWSEYIEFVFELKPNTTYSISKKSRVVSGTSYRFAGALRFHDLDTSSYGVAQNADSITFTTGSVGKAGILFYTSYLDPTKGNVSSSIEFFDVQLEESASATPFEPYVGGEPSPNPDYPQPIQTVTGLQTISINGTEYPLDLGDIELCGLGDDGNGSPLYKDYIYPDGKDWKIHKATAKSIFKDIEWHTSRISNTDHYRQESISIKTEVLIPTSNTKFIGACSRYTVVTAGDTYAYPQKTGVAIQFSGYSTSGNIYVYDPLYDAPNRADNFKAARANTEIYYALATPTDTVIADQTLIEQLEAIRTASLQNGANTITNTAIGSNLAGDMEVGYYGYNPRNRYDKWLWLEINNEYEQIGS